MQGEVMKDVYMFKNMLDSLDECRFVLDPNAIIPKMERVEGQVTWTVAFGVKNLGEHTWNPP